VAGLGEVDDQLGGGIGEANGAVAVFGVHGKYRTVTHLVEGQRELVALAREDILVPVNLVRLDDPAHAHAQDRHEGDVRHLRRPRDAYPGSRGAQSEGVAVLDEGDEGRLAHRLGRRLHPLRVDVLGIKREPAAAHHREAARLHVLLERLVALRVAERAHHLARPEQVQILLEADAALARVDVEGPPHLEIHGAERRHDGGANGEGADGEGRIGDGGDEDLRARRRRHDHEEEEGEEREAMRQGHRQMITDL
jgi:hypothetical protein